MYSVDEDEAAGAGMDEEEAGGGRGIVLAVRPVGRSTRWLGARSCDNSGIWLSGLSGPLFLSSCLIGHSAGRLALTTAGVGVETGASSVGTYLDVEVLETCMGHSAGGVPEVGC